MGPMTHLTDVVLVADSAVMYNADEGQATANEKQGGKEQQLPEIQANADPKLVEIRSRGPPKRVLL